jgi:hypothetical protein
MKKIIALIAMLTLATLASCTKEVTEAPVVEVETAIEVEAPVMDETQMEAMEDETPVMDETETMENEAPVIEIEANIDATVETETTSEEMAK